MPDTVLIVTGGLITSQEKSLFSAARKCWEQFSRARHAWLDLKVKLTVAEPLVAGVCERMQGLLSPGKMRQTVRGYFANPVETNTPPLTEVVLATLLDKAGLAYQCMSLDTLFTDPARAEQWFGQTSCVFLSTTYLHDLSELEVIVQRLKRPHNRLVAGGALMGVLAGSWGGLPGIDLVAVGYGEMLVDAIAAWLRSGCAELRTPERGRVERKEHSWFLYSGVPAGRSLDDLILPDWGRAQRDHQQRFRMIYYESVRGCPYRCNFCNYPFLFDDTVFRWKSARKMADDWSHYVETLGVEYITCLDSLFTIPRERLVEFCRLLSERRLPVKWVCYARADDLADERTVAMMKAAGAHQVQIGIESGDPQLLENMNKACSVETNRQALANCRRYGLASVVSLIVGFPGETEASLERTYRFLEETPPDFYFLATFSTRVAGVPLLQADNRQRFGLEVMPNLYSMAPYWRHQTMSCAEVGNHVRQLDQRLMRNRVALNAALFFAGMLNYDQVQRPALLEYQQRVAQNHALVRGLFDMLHRWVDGRLRRDVARHFAASGKGGAKTMNPLRYLRDGCRWLGDPYGLLDDALRRQGLTFRIRLPVLGDVLMTGDPQLIAEIVQHPNLDAGKTVTALRAILGQRSLIMLDGEVHAARHRLISPMFRGECLKAFDELTVQHTQALLAELPHGETISMYPVLQRITRQVMVVAMFGADSGVAGFAETTVERFLKSFRNPLTLFSPLLRLDLGSWSPWGRAVRNRRALCDLIRQQMQYGKGSTDTILARLTAAASAGDLSAEDVVEEVLSLLLFGHDTAAASMAWTFAHIYSDRDLVEHLREQEGSPEEQPLLQACIKESMRLCPVVVHLSRTATADLRLGGFEVRRGQKVIPCTYLAQHNPEVFLEPYEFRPERFLDGQHYEHAYFPFGFGGRTCVGKPFALRQMQLVLATALRSGNLELAPEYRPTPTRHLVLIVPRSGTLMLRKDEGGRMKDESETAARIVPTFGVPDYGSTPPDMPIPNHLNLFLVALVFAGGVALLWLGSQVSAWFSVLLVGIPFSYLMLTNYALLHEVSHGNLHSGRRLNYLLGMITGLLFPIPFRLMRTTHQNHHNHNRTDHEMFDLYYPSDNRFLKRWQWYNLLCGMFWPLIPIGSVLFALFPGLLRWQLLRQADPARGIAVVANLERAAIRALRLELLLIVAFFTVLFTLLGLAWQNTLVLYACFSFNWSTRQYVGHAFSRRDVVEGAWNLRQSRWMSWLLLHGEWDLNHHRRPDVPWYYLPQLSPADEPRLSYWKQYWRQWFGPRPCVEPAPQPHPPRMTNNQ